jgi:hypothetical protein
MNKNITTNYVDPRYAIPCFPLQVQGENNIFNKHKTRTIKFYSFLKLYPLKIRIAKQMGE